MESIASAVEVKGPDDDVFEHFEGGRLGVQKRFGEKIKSSLKGLNGLDAIRLAQDVGLEAEQVADISRGNFSKINSAVIEALADPLGLSIEECIGEMVNFDGNAVAIQKWTERARKEQCGWVGGATLVESLSSEQAVKLFIALRCIDKL